MAELLRPVLGDHWHLPSPPAFAAELEGLVKELQQCSSMSELIERKLIVRGREIKERASEEYFSASGLIAFTRFNYLVRRGFFRLMHSDLHAIRLALHELEQRGIKTVDCSAAGLSASEPIAALREASHDWKTPFRAPYAAEKNFGQILGILKAVKTAVAQPPTLAVETRAVPKPTSAQISGESVVSSKVEAHQEPADATVASVTSNGSSQSNMAVSNRSEAPMSLTPKTPAHVITLPVMNRLEECLEQIAEKLISAAAKNASMSVIMLGATKFALASWELAAFVHGGNDIEDSLQRAVAARAMIEIAVEEKKSDNAANLDSQLSLAHVEAAAMQERIAEAKDAKNIDGAVSLAATAKRLLAKIEEAEKI